MAVLEQSNQSQVYFATKQTICKCENAHSDVKINRNHWNVLRKYIHCKMLLGMCAV